LRNFSIATESTYGSSVFFSPNPAAFLRNVYTSARGGTLLKSAHEVKILGYKSGWRSMLLKIPECSNPTRLLSYTLSQPAVCGALMGVSSTKELAENITYLDVSPKEKEYKALLA
jgi:aryl-alcohol dehydrogenase-like predicted oxidoreductase